MRTFVLIILTILLGGIYNTLTAQSNIYFNNQVIYTNLTGTSSCAICLAKELRQWGLTVPQVAV